MLTGSDRAHSSSSAGESQSQSQDQNEAQAQAAQSGNSAARESQSPTQLPAEADSATVESTSAPQEAESPAEAEAAAPAAVHSSSKRSFNLKSVIDQTMRRQMSSVYADAVSSPHHHVGQGFAKWISRAVGNAGLKEKTEIEDLPAYRLRVGSAYISCILCFE